MTMDFRAIPCSCGRPDVCTNWFVDPVAAMPGVAFTKFQAKAVAALLNGLVWDDVDVSKPAPELAGTHPVILYFATDADREELIGAVRAEKPNMTARRL